MTAARTKQDEEETYRDKRTDKKKKGRKTKQQENRAQGDDDYR